MSLKSGAAYVLELKVQHAELFTAGAEKLYKIRPYINEANVDEWVSKAASLSRSDLAIEIKEAFPPASSLPFKEKPGVFLRCAAGGVLVWVFSQNRSQSIWGAFLFSIC